MIKPWDIWMQKFGENEGKKRENCCGKRKANNIFKEGLSGSQGNRNCDDDISSLFYRDSGTRTIWSFFWLAFKRESSMGLPVA